MFDSNLIDFVSNLKSDTSVTLLESRNYDTAIENYINQGKYGAHVYIAAANDISPETKKHILSKGTENDVNSLVERDDTDAGILTHVMTSPKFAHLEDLHKIAASHTNQNPVSLGYAARSQYPSVVNIAAKHPNLSLENANAIINYGNPTAISTVNRRINSYDVHIMTKPSKEGDYSSEALEYQKGYKQFHNIMEGASLWDKGLNENTPLDSLNQFLKLHEPDVHSDENYEQNIKAALDGVPSNSSHNPINRSGQDISYQANNPDTGYWSKKFTNDYLDGVFGQNKQNILSKTESF